MRGDIPYFMSSAPSSGPVDALTRAAWARHLGRPPAELDPAEVRTRLATVTIPEALALAARTSPATSLGVDGSSASYAELVDEVDRGAAALVERGLDPGDRVAICAGGSLDLVRAYLSVLRARGVAVLANPAYTRDELGRLLEQAGARLLLHDRDRTALPAVGAAVDIADWGARAGELAPYTGPGPGLHDVALLAFTSGTTGTPKGVPLTHAHLTTSIAAAMAAWRWEPGDVLVHCLPLFHQHGLSGVHASLLAGSAAHLLTRYDAEELLATIERVRATVMFGVPAIHRRLLELDRERLAPLRGLRLMTSGSGPLPRAVAEAVTEATGQRLLERYGLTETGLDLSNPYDGPRITGTVGYPLPGVEARISDADGAELPDGTDGEICLRGPQVFDGYLDDPAATAAAFWPGGWFRTGDVGHRDSDGRYALTGRLKELVITGGMNVSPQEVEGVVEALDWVHEAAVAGLPSDEWGEEVAVWVVPRPGSEARPADVLEHCRERLAGYKRPKRVFLVDSLPRNALGKIMRSALTAPGPAGPTGDPAGEP